MSGAEAGWRPHPDAVEKPAGLPRIAPARVVGLGAICDLGPQRQVERCQSFSVSEFATLEDGRRAILHHDRGFTLGRRASDGRDPDDPPAGLTIESMTRDVLNVVLPDDDECAEDHPWSWLAGLARERGLDVTAEELRAVPYEVVFTDAVRRWLGVSV